MYTKVYLYMFMYIYTHICIYINIPQNGKPFRSTGFPVDRFSGRPVKNQLGVPDPGCSKIGRPAGCRSTRLNSPAGLPPVDRPAG